VTPGILFHALFSRGSLDVRGYVCVGNPGDGKLLRLRGKVTAGLF